MEEEASPQQVAQVGRHFRDGLEKLWEQYPLIGEIRGKGLMQGVEKVKDQKSKEPAAQEVNFLFEETRKRGLLIGKGGLYGNVLRIAPPLIATKDHVDEAIDILDHAFAQVQEMSL